MSKKAIKVSFNGETKRFKMTNSYDALAANAKEVFGQELGKVWPIRFYYLDDENELISITSQSDFQEALSIDDLPILKLTVASNVQEARLHLEKLHNDTLSLSESLNQSQMMGQSLRMSTSNFGNVPMIPRVSEVANPFPVLDSERREIKKISHEMGVGSDNIN